MINKNKDDNGSIKKLKEIFRFPVLIQSNNGNTIDLTEASFISKNNIKLKTKERKIDKLPISPTKGLGIYLRPRPLIKNPINGNKGIKALFKIINLKIK